MHHLPWPTVHLSIPFFLPPSFLPSQFLPSFLPWHLSVHPFDLSFFIFSSPLLFIGFISVSGWLKLFIVRQVRTHFPHALSLSQPLKTLILACFVVHFVGFANLQALQVIIQPLNIYVRVNFVFKGLNRTSSQFRKRRRLRLYAKDTGYQEASVAEDRWNLFKEKKT